MKFFTAICIGLTALLFAAGCSTAPARQLPETAILIDVRTSEEFDQRSLPGTILIPHDKIAETIFQKVSDKNTPIAVFCRSGRRSAIARKTLIDLGYTNITDLGGIEDAAKSLGKEIIVNKK